MDKKQIIESLRTTFHDWQQTVPPDVYGFIEEYVMAAPEAEIIDFIVKFEKAGKEWGFFPYSRFVQQFLIQTIRKIITVEEHGFSHLEKAMQLLKSGEADRIIICSNHVSYSDANLMATYFYPLMDRYGFGSDFSVVVGPKVFNEKFKVLSSMQFNSLLVAQSLARATLEAAMSPREIAKAAKKVIDDIKTQVKFLLIFPEGGRSRNYAMIQFLAGVYKLIDSDEKVFVLPVSVTGGEVMLPINEKQLHPAQVTISVAEPVSLASVKEIYAHSEHQKQEVMDYFGRQVAALLPPERRGFYS